ncbi:hypothetical protein [Flavobacterium phage FPSV-F12]|nr:hypothetical protein [Flavobacterium phage FPSV-F12]
MFPVPSSNTISCVIVTFPVQAKPSTNDTTNTVSTNLWKPKLISQNCFNFKGTAVKLISVNTFVALLAGTAL